MGLCEKVLVCYELDPLFYLCVVVSVYLRMSASLRVCTSNLLCSLGERGHDGKQSHRV